MMQSDGNSKDANELTERLRALRTRLVDFRGRL